VPTTGPATAGRSRSGCFTQSTNVASAAWATRPSQDRFSADIVRNQGSRLSIDAMAAVPSGPMERSSRRTVSSRTRAVSSCPAPAGDLLAAVIPPDCHERAVRAERSPVRPAGCLVSSRVVGRGPAAGGGGVSR
jgi:hypothetical protein